MAHKKGSGTKFPVTGKGIAKTQTGVVNCSPNSKGGKKGR